MVSASRPSPPETDSSVETDLQPFREAIALHGNQDGLFFIYLFIYWLKEKEVSELRVCF